MIMNKNNMLCKWLCRFCEESQKRKHAMLNMARKVWQW